MPRLNFLSQDDGFLMGATLNSVHPILAAKDVITSVRFFEALGFHLSFQDDPKSPRYAAVTRDGIELHLQWADDQQWAFPTDRPTYRFVVSDVDEIFSEFSQSGCIDPSSASPWAKPAHTPWGTREFHLRDPGKNGLQFYQPA